MTETAAADPVALAAELVRAETVTPDDGVGIALLETRLAAAGFRCVRCDRGGVANLFARFGTRGPVLGFNGHTDVVPTGDPAAWSRPPFSGEIAEGRLHGRGACDMKTGVAAFVAAALDWAEGRDPDAPGSVALLVTGDEEGPSEHGTLAILERMAELGEGLDGCVVGEPTSREAFGDMVKIGRRGSLTARITARGRQGHTAYPHRALNPLPALAQLCARLAAAELDQGTEHFEPSTLALASIDTGNPASNVIPAEAAAVLNVRFNDRHDGAALRRWLEAEAARAAEETGVALSVATRVSGEAFLTPPGPLSDALSNAIEAETGRRPELSTSGGTSDARFVKAICPVAEFGLVGLTMHQTDEWASIEEIEALARVYRRLIDGFTAV
ncbi:MAG: succinyl-diaminopimelate desuccinylase [Paracoccaceae bacterium]